MKSNTPKDIFENVQFIQVCPLCNTKYDKKETHILHGSGAAHFVHTTCSSCRSSIMAVVRESPLGISSAGIMTDMNYDDIMRFDQEEPISADDCLNLHLFLNTFINTLHDNVETYDISTERNTKNSRSASRARRG